jgi:hypothetical protein
MRGRKLQLTSILQNGYTVLRTSLIKAKKYSDVISTVTKKGKILFFIPFFILTFSMIYCWGDFILTNSHPYYSNYLGLLLFLPLVYFLLKDKTLKKAIVFTGVYLGLATINLVSFLPFHTSTFFELTTGSFDINWKPELNLFALFLFITYLIMNFGALIEIYLDYKEIKGKL